MRVRTGVCGVLCVLSVSAWANSSLYITDSVSVAMYADQALVGEPTQRLLSGTPIEVLQRHGELVQIKTETGTVGWVRASFVTSQVPAVHQLDQAQQNIDQLQQEIIDAEKRVNKLEAENAELQKLVWVRNELKKARLRIDELEKVQANTEQAKGEQASSVSELESQLTQLSAENADLFQRLAASEMILTDRMASQAEQSSAITFPAILAGVSGLILGVIPGLWWGHRRLEQKIQARFGGIKLY